MSKKTENTEEAQVQTAEEQQTATIPAASASGMKVLTDKTREGLFSRVEELKTALKEGQTLIAGAVGRNDQGIYTIRIDII